MNTSPTFLNIVQSGAFAGCVKMLSADATVAAGTGTTPQSVTTTATVIKLTPEWASALLFLDIQGANAGSAGNVDVYLEVSPDGTATSPRWFRQDKITVALNGSAVCDTDPETVQSLDLSNGLWLRVAAVGNADPTYTVRFNAYLGRSN